MYYLSMQVISFLYSIFKIDIKDRKELLAVLKYGPC